MADDIHTPRRRYRNDLAPDYIRELLSYDPETGIVRWKVKRGRGTGRYKPGDVAGHRDKGDGYRKIGVDGKTYLAHRLIYAIVTGKWPTEQIDHRDLNRGNNKWTNIRPATSGENSMNHPGHKTKSGYKGVYYFPKNRKWGAKITANKEAIFLGLYETPELAHAAYAAAAKRLHGEFARSSGHQQEPE